MPTATVDDQELQDLRQMAVDHLWLPFHQMNDFAEAPDSLKIYESGEGCWLTDINGRKAFDMMSGMWLQAVGYGRKEIADAVYEAMQGITSNPWAGTNPHTIRVSAKIASLAPDKGSRVFLTNGGAESNEVALKIAKKYHKIQGDADRYKVISRTGSYHGGTHATMAAGGGGIAAPEDYGPLQPGNIHVTQPYAYRCALCAENGACTLACAREVESVIEAEGPETVAAFIGEPMSVTGGVYVPHDDYWPTIREICDRYGVLMIMDEVVTGYGRTGKWFASMHWDVQPDITTMAKQLSSGYLPAAGAIVRKDVADTFLGRRGRKIPPSLHLRRAPDCLCRGTGQPEDHRRRKPGGEFRQDGPVPVRPPSGALSPSLRRRHTRRQGVVRRRRTRQGPRDEGALPGRPGRW